MISMINQKNMGISIALYLMLVLFSSCLMPSCGAKSAVSIAENQNLPKLDSLNIKVEQNKAQISWTFQNTQKTPPDGFLIYRKHWEQDKPVNPATATTLLLIDIEHKPLDELEHASFSDNSITQGFSYEYHVFPYIKDNAGKQTLGTSLVSGTFMLPAAPKSVENFQALGKGGYIELSWKAVKSENAYQSAVLVYRSQAENKTEEILLSKDAIIGNAYLDNTATSKQTYSYRVKSVLLMDHVMVLGKFSEIKQAKSKAVNPMAVKLMWIKQVKGGVRLRWHPSDAPNILGYLVKRKSDKESEYKDISGLISVDEFTDRTIDSEGNFTYRIILIDIDGNKILSKEHKIEYLLNLDQANVDQAENTTKQN